MRKLYIHCGTHKTGSTALQEYLSVNYDLLRHHDYLYPVSGKNSSLNGQHNIAWELSHHRLYLRSYGNTSDLFNEISEFDGNVILSSEGFEWLLCHPDRWKPFIDKLKSLGFTIILVLYVRNQLSYFESLYAQLLNGWCAGEYLSYANRITSMGTLAIDEAEFNFDYSHLIDKLTEYENVNFIFRNFHQLKGQCVASDFLSLLEIDAFPIDNSAQLVRNSRDSLYSSLCLFYRNRKGKKLRFADKLILSSVADFLEKLPYKRSSALTDNFIGAFHKSNEKVADLFPDVNLNDYFSNTGNEIAYDTKAINMQRLFSFETYVALRQLTFEMRDFSFLVDIIKDKLSGNLFDTRLHEWADWVTVD
jgi:hypothetical protein